MTAPTVTRVGNMETGILVMLTVRHLKERYRRGIEALDRELRININDYPVRFQKDWIGFMLQRLDAVALEARNEHTKRILHRVAPSGRGWNKYGLLSIQGYHQYVKVMDNIAERQLKHRTDLYRRYEDMLYFALIRLPIVASMYPPASVIPESIGLSYSFRPVPPEERADAARRVDNDQWRYPGGKKHRK